MPIRLTSFIKIQFGVEAEIIRQLKEIPEIVKIYSVTGEFDILIEIAVDTTERLIEILFNRIELIPGLLDVQSHLILDTWDK